MSSRCVPALLPILAAAVLAAGPPIPPGAKPTNHGAIRAGEGPAWHPQMGLLYSGGGHINRRDLKGEVSIHREGAGSNGLLFDRQGRLVICESRARRITRIEADGGVTVMAADFEGKPFNSPNDLAIDSKGRIYFTDPRYGNRDTMEIRDAAGRLVEGVYRIDAPGKVTRVITHEIDRPNGILVSPGDDFLYVADNNNNNNGAPRLLARFALRPDGTVDPASKRVLFDWKDGRGPDGFKMDQEGRLFVAAGRTESRTFETADKFKGGIYVLSPEGELLEFVPIPVDEVTNCAFGGADWKTLFITAGGTLWSIPTSAPGRHLFAK
jgi:gluconolactonase